MMRFVILSVFALIIISVYVWLKHCYQYWEHHGLPYLKPTSLFFGNDYEVVTGKISQHEYVSRLYNGLAPYNFGGVFNFHKPVLCIRDPELIKNVLIKDFHHFHDRNSKLANKDEPLSLHLFNQVGEKWKILRNKLAPAFTAGKTKMLFPLIKESADRMGEIIRRKSSENEAVPVKNVMSRYTIDNISSCVFGLEADSLHNPHSIFREKGKEVWTPTLRKRLRKIFFTLSPKFVKLLGWRNYSKQLNHFFVNLVRDTIRYRTENQIFRNDFLNLLMKIQNAEQQNRTKNFDFNMEILTAQCYLFFVAGFETSANSMSFILYLLAEHPDIQQKVQAEIDTVLQKHHGQITYDSLQDLHFMDQVFNETSRLYPASPAMLRMCTEDYPIPESGYVIRKGQMVLIPVYALHRDPQYYPNPGLFNPNNFSEQVKASRPSCCFLPFGGGPKICIAWRFGMTQIKLGLITILENYTVTVAPEMKRPIQFMKHNKGTTTQDEILLHFTRRNNIVHETSK